VLPVDREDPADHIRSISDRDELERAFRSLPLDQRAVFVLHHHVGLPLVAVAETLGIPDGTARSRLHYATRALRAAFEANHARDVEREGQLA
jgi:RNA polymerase sigma-70 factor (ECF subfamily)